MAATVPYVVAIVKHYQGQPVFCMWWLLWNISRGGQCSVCGGYCETLPGAANVRYVVDVVKHYRGSQCSLCGGYCETLPEATNVPYVMAIVKHYQGLPMFLMWRLLWNITMGSQCSLCGGYCEALPMAANVSYVAAIVIHYQGQPMFLMWWLLYTNQKNAKATNSFLVRIFF